MRFSIAPLMLLALSSCAPDNQERAVVVEERPSQGAVESPPPHGNLSAEQEIEAIAGLWERGKHMEASELLEDLVEHSGDNLFDKAARNLRDVHWYYISSLLEAQDDLKAQRHFERLNGSELSQGWKDFFNWSWALECVGRIDDALAALAHAEQALKVSGKRENLFELQIKHALLFGRNNQFDEAVRLIDSALLAANETEQSYWVGWREDYEKTRQAYVIELQCREADPRKQNPRVEFETSKGRFVMELFEDEAPNFAANMVKLANDRAFDGAPCGASSYGFFWTEANATGDFSLQYEKSGRRFFVGSVCAGKEFSDVGLSDRTYGSHIRVITRFSPTLCTRNEGDGTFVSSGVVFGRIVEGMGVVHRLRDSDKIITARATNLRNHVYEPVRLMKDR